MANNIIIYGGVAVTGAMLIGAGVNSLGAWGLRKVTNMTPSIKGAAINGAVSGGISFSCVICIYIICEKLLNFKRNVADYASFGLGLSIGFFATMALAPRIGKAIKQPNELC